MNSAVGRRVRTRVLIVSALATALCSTVHGCTDVHGGAVELSWHLENADGNAVSCEDARIATMWLRWQAGSMDEGEAGPWACKTPSVVTGFVVPQGELAFWVEPTCEGGVAASPGSYTAPAPIVRSVIRGDVVTLNAIVVTVQMDIDPEHGGQMGGCGCNCICRTSRAPTDAGACDAGVDAANPSDAGEPP